MTEKLTDEALEELAEELNNDMTLFPHEKRVAALAITELLALRRSTPAYGTEAPCRHEWYQGQCAHCEMSVKDFRRRATSADDLRAAVALLMNTPLEVSLAHHVKLVCKAISKKLDADAAALAQKGDA